jgi:hypothetical protein
MSDAQVDPQAQRDTKDRYTVHVANEDDGDSTEIGANRGTKISEIIAEMYRNFHLERKAGDRLHCRNSQGTNVFEFSELTLEEYIEHGHCPELKWAFAAETGGA